LNLQETEKLSTAAVERALSMIFPSLLVFLSKRWSDLVPYFARRTTTASSWRAINTPSKPAHFSLEGATWWGPNRAHRATTGSSWQAINTPSELARFSKRGGLAWSPTAHVGRAQLHRARSINAPSKSTPSLQGTVWIYPRIARIDRAHSDRARSASRGIDQTVPPPPLRFPSSPAAHRIHARKRCSECNPTRP
jgi:hypothetical protein